MPWSCAWAESFGLMREVRSKLSVRTAWGIIPERYGESGIDGAKPGYEMILKRADGALGGVDSVVVGFHELVFGAGFENGRFDGFGRFIVHNIQLGLEAMLCELCVENTVGPKRFFVAAIFHRLNKNRITVIIVQYEHVFVAGQGCDGESSGKVGVDNIVVFVCKANVRKYGVGLGWGLCREQVGVDVAGSRSEGFGVVVR
jgi:hypothetical protein